MTSPNVKGELHSYLQGARDTILWKLDGLTEYDVRRPLTPTGTSLLGLVKHSAATELSYFGTVFGRAPKSTRPRRVVGSLRRLAHSNLPARDPAWWTEHRDRVEQAARLASDP